MPQPRFFDTPQDMPMAGLRIFRLLTSVDRKTPLLSNAEIPYF